MMYRSTRGDGGIVSSAQAIKQGLAGDGGLFMPEEPPCFQREDFERLCAMTYSERAAFVLSRFLTDYTYDELAADCRAAYDEKRFPGGAAPIAAVDDQVRVLELWHGPTCAFKDMALQIMPRLLSRALVKTGEERTAFILVATSGDTGKAALEGYRDAERVRMMVYYPADGVSRVQKLQMATQEGANVAVRSVKGNFDDTQNGVKRIFSDREAADLLDRNGYFLSSANSINWGRLAPQIVYYISAYCDMINRGDLRFGEEINVCVPTGNFGNIFAGYLAKRVGLPIHRFLCASNRNKILSDFFATGTYDRNREFFTTMSPSMDILISSNLERLLYLAAGPEKTTDYMRKLVQDGAYTVDSAVKKELDSVFTGYFCDEINTAAAIRTMYERCGYLIDTHTAVGVDCAYRFIRDTGDERKMLCVSTASPYKFASNVYKALTGSVYEDEFKNIEALCSLTHTVIPEPLAALASKKIRFDPNAAIEADAMKDEVFRELGI